MAISPIDMHLMVQKTTDVNRTNMDAKRMGDEQTMFADQFQKEIKQESQKAAKSEKSEGESIKDKEGRNKGKHQASKREKEKEEKKKKNNNNSGSLFDVSI